MKSSIIGRYQYRMSKDRAFDSLLKKKLFFIYSDNIMGVVRYLMLMEETHMVEAIPQTHVYY